MQALSLGLGKAALVRSNLVRRLKGVGTALLAVALSGCNLTWFEDRDGPPPVLSAAAVQASTANYDLLLTEFIRRTRLPEPPVPSSNWYFVMEAGFGYVDEICDAYIDDLFKLNRGRDRAKSALTLLDKTTSAILTVTSASKASMEIVAQAFGLASGSADIFADSYLYRLDPANIQKMVKDSRDAYRVEAQNRQFAKTAGANTVAPYSTPAAVYHGIQGYLLLCLPPTIERQVNSLVAGSQTVGDPSHPSTPVIKLISGSQPAPTHQTVTQNVGGRDAPRVISTTTAGPDNTSKLINDWLAPNGVTNQMHLDTLNTYLNSIGGVQVRSFLFDKEFSAQRAQFVRAQGISH